MESSKSSVFNKSILQYKNLSSRLDIQKLTHIAKTICRTYPCWFTKVPKWLAWSNFKLLTIFGSVLLSIKLVRLWMIMLQRRSWLTYFLNISIGRKCGTIKHIVLCCLRQSIIDLHRSRFSISLLKQCHIENVAIKVRDTILFISYPEGHKVWSSQLPYEPVL